MRRPLDTLESVQTRYSNVVHFAFTFLSYLCLQLISTCFLVQSLQQQYTTERTWTFTDGCNSNTLSQTIIINDDTAPEFESFPGNKIMTCEDPCAKDFLLASTCTGLPTAKDNCDGSVSPTKVDAVIESSSFPGVVITRTWTASDGCANQSSQPQVIEVYDACSFSVSDAFSGVDINVAITVTNVEGENAVLITVAVDDPVRTGDIRGVFFTVTGDGEPPITDIVGDEVTDYKVAEGAVDRLSNDVLMKGGGKDANMFDVSFFVNSPRETRYKSTAQRVPRCN